MNNLVAIIGPAPSEDLELFARKLAQERLRIGQALQEIRNYSPQLAKAPAKKKRDLSPEEALEAMRALGINSIEEMVAKIKEMKASGTDVDKDD